MTTRTDGLVDANRAEALVRLRVWDLPTRLFHWGIVLLLAASWASVELGWIELHLLSGFAMLALLLFRLAWGLVGSETARFGSFVVSPLRGLRHLAKFGRPEPDTQVGHNAAGGWMVLLLLLLLAAQVATGLCANDDVMTQGPLAGWVGKAASDQLTDLHSLLFNLILAAIALHVLAVAAYVRLKRHDLLRPMLTGWKRLPRGQRPPRMASPITAVAVLAVAIAVAAAVANLS